MKTTDLALALSIDQEIELLHFCLGYIFAESGNPSAELKALRRMITEEIEEMLKRP